MSEHSKLPWRLGANVKDTVFMGEHDFCPHARCYSNPQPEGMDLDIANAELIVEAVNNHHAYKARIAELEGLIEDLYRQQHEVDSVKYMAEPWRRRIDND